MSEPEDLAFMAIREEEPSSGGTAHDFIQRCAETTNSWLENLDRAGALKEMRGVVAAVLPGGDTVILNRMGAEGDSLVKIEGQMADGSPCLLIAHLHSIQILTKLVPRKPGDPPKREIGFHTLVKVIKLQV